MSANPGFVKITSVSDRMQANLIASLLEGCGFHVMTNSDDAGGGLTSYDLMTAASGITISVLESEAPAALAVLKDSGEF